MQTGSIEERAQALLRQLQQLNASMPLDLELQPRLSSADVAALEAAHGLTLPGAWRAIITEVGGGIRTSLMFSMASPQAALSERSGVNLPFSIAPTAISESINTMLRAAGTATVDTVETKRGIVDDAWIEADADLPGCIQLCDTGDGWDAMLVVAGPSAGMVFYRGEPGWHPEVKIEAGVATPHDVISWAATLVLL